ncbi:hypothetical protein GCM10023334_126170 [Nonomuraea thailandensis]
MYYVCDFLVTAHHLGWGHKRQQRYTRAHYIGKDVDLGAAALNGLLGVPLSLGVYPTRFRGLPCRVFGGHGADERNVLR